jgi:hypothetical protein
VPHPTTLVKLVGRGGPEVIGQLNAALVAKLAQDKLLRGPSWGWTPPWWRPTFDHPTDADLLEGRWASWVGWCDGSRPRGGPPDPVPGSWPGCGSTHEAARPSRRRRGGEAMVEVDRLTGEVAGLARQPLRQVQRWCATPAGRWARQPPAGRLGRLVGELEATIGLTGRPLARPTSGWPATG